MGAADGSLKYVSSASAYAALYAFLLPRLRRFPQELFLKNDLKTVLEIDLDRATSNIIYLKKKNSLDKFAPITVIGRV